MSSEQELKNPQMFNKEKKTGERLKVREELATIYSEIWQEEIRLTSKLQSQRSNVEQGIKKSISTHLMSSYLEQQFQSHRNLGLIGDCNKIR